MAGPANSIGDAATSASAVPKEAVFPLPPPSALKPLQQSPAPAPSVSATAPSVHVITPPRGTLAAGKWEAKPATIWIVVAVGTILLLAWALFRVRRASVARRKKLEALTTVRKPSA